MKVSVIIATYRRDESLKRAIASVQKQTYPNIEIIVVDDNADGNWNNKVESIVTSIENIKYIKNENNSGSAKSRNFGIAAATGEYVTFLDDDDEYLPKKIEKQLEVMLREQSDFCLSDLWLYNEDGSFNSKRERPFLTSANNEDLIRYHLMYHITGTDTMMFKADYLREIGGFTEIDVGDEYYLSMKAIQHGGKFSYLHSCDVKAYVHLNDSISNGDGKIAGENALFEYKKQFFSELPKASVRYIRMRHHAVLAFVYLKQKKMCNLLSEAVKGFVCSPVGMLKVLKQRG